MDITQRVRGKTIAAVTCNGSVLRLTMTDNSEIDVIWVNDNGQPIKGRPAIGNAGVRLNARGLSELVYMKGMPV